MLTSSARPWRPAHPTPKAAAQAVQRGPQCVIIVVSQLLQQIVAVIVQSDKEGHKPRRMEARLQICHVVGLSVIYVICHIVVVLSVVSCQSRTYTGGKAPSLRTVARPQHAGPLRSLYRKYSAARFASWEEKRMGGESPPFKAPTRPRHDIKESAPPDKDEGHFPDLSCCRSECDLCDLSHCCLFLSCVSCHRRSCWK